jgi:hypothetical protein
MKVSRLSSLMCASSLLFCASAFAGNTIKKSLHLSETATVEGRQLAPGDYKVEWSGSGPNVKVNILKGRQTVATVSAQIVSQGASNEQDGYVLKPGDNGKQSIADIFFSGEKYDLKIDQSANANPSQGANTGDAN